MPSQNLPKPNIPGQTNQVFQAGVSNPPTPQQQAVAPQGQVVPGGLSRENPGGTPPNMTVTAPTSGLPSQKSISDNSPRPGVPSKPSESNIPNRPNNPLSQISLKDISADKKPELDVNKPSQVQGNTPAPVQNLNKPELKSPSSTPNAPTAPAGGVGSDPKAKKGFSLAGIFKGKLPMPAVIAVVVLLVILLGVLIFNLLKPKTSSKPSSSTSSETSATEVTTLTYWGLWEDSQILKQVITDFESQNPSIKIDYRKQSHKDYRERLQQAISSGNGPDIFRYHVAWVPMLGADLAALPSTVMSTTDYKQLFYPSAYNNLQVGGQIVGIPLMYDGLALFYNKEMLKTANIEVPSTWAELRTAANKLTVPTNAGERSNDNITRAGLAIGNAGNVDNFSDILALLIIQNGGNPANANTQYVEDAITFYTNFIRQDKVWSDRLANSTTAFARGDVAMIIAPSWRVHEVKNLNPSLDFAIAGVPQLDNDNPVAWATFWAEGVSAKSKNKDASWKFLKYLVTPEVLRKFYNDASQYRAFGEIYSRTDMASELETSELVAAYLADAPIAKSWYMSSFTHDNGINDQVIKYYEDAVNAVLTGNDIDKALTTTATGVNSVLSKYSSGN